MKQPPYRNPKLSYTERACDLVRRMTLREKIAQMLHKAPPIPRLGLPAYNWWSECLHGVARAGQATVFPQAIGMAASFNDGLVRKVASAISDEARAKHHQAARQGNRGIYFGLTLWAPNINIFRDPRWGRGQETYGEDPYLTARLGVAFCRGLQGNDPHYLKAIATPKHYAVHSGPEHLRHQFDAQVSQRDLWETYLPAFRACVQEAGAGSVMGAYNRTNGEPCCGSPTLLRTILREQWGFKGYVVSDCWAIKDFHANHKVTQTPEESVALAVRNGCDLNCGDIYPRLLDAVRQGLVSEADIDRCVGRLMEARLRLGMFDPESRVPFSKIPPSVVHCRKHRRLALQMARESLVLLKNDGVLPLRREVRNMLVVGPTAMDYTALVGNYHGWAPELVTFVEGLVGRASVGTQVAYCKGCDLTGDRPLERPWELKEATLDVIVAVVGYTAALEGEETGVALSDGGDDRKHIRLPGRQQELLELLVGSGKPVVLVVTGGSPIDLSWAREHCAAVLFAWYPGEQGGNAVADVIFGDYNPAGRLPITFVKSFDQLPPFTDYAMKGRTYRFMDAEPLYRFGYGLSYTTFKYSRLSAVQVGRSVRVQVDVKNAGRRAGDEVVQLYVRDVEASAPVPRHHLEAFRRVQLRAGEKRTVRFSLKIAQLACYGDDGQPFVEPGDFRISLGGGQPDDPASAAVTTVLRVKAVSVA